MGCHPGRAAGTRPGEIARLAPVKSPRYSSIVRPYDFYRELLETHRENGYLGIMAIAVGFYDLCLLICILMWPETDIYLIKGVDRYGEAEITWGVPMPEQAQRTNSDGTLVVVDPDPFMPVLPPPNPGFFESVNQDGPAQ